MKKLFSLLVLLGLLGTTTTFAGALSTGDQAPDFTLTSSKGDTVNLSQYAGKVIVLEWFNHNCPFVHKFYDSGKMQQWQAEAISRGAVWLTIDSTSPSHKDYLGQEQAENIFEQMHLASTALLLDPQGTVGHLYGAVTTPHIFIIGQDGHLLYQGSVDDIRSSNPNDIARGENYLLTALDAALTGTRPENSSTRPYGCSVKYAQ